MQAIGYFLLLPFIYLVAVLPFPLLYLFSDFLFFCTYCVFRYRRKVVMTNLRNAFPGKSDQELRRISRRFYRFLCDFLLETLKTLVITRTNMERRCSFTPQAAALFDRYHAGGRSIVAVMGHWGNWEWSGHAFALQRPHTLYALYHPLKHQYFNRLIIRMRTRFGLKLIPMKDAMKTMLANRHSEPHVTTFIADQTPQPDRAYWTTFLNQDTPVFQGTEKIAQKLDEPVVYVSVRRIRRGYYEIDAETLFEHPAKTAEGEITLAHTRRLEKDIHAQPEIWLWSHRRWKHRRPQGS